MHLPLSQLTLRAPARLMAPALALSLALATGVARAQAFDAVRLYGVPSGSGEGTVGLAVVQGHRYSGSDESRTRLFPVLDYRWSNGWFAGTGNGVGYVFASAPNLQYGLRLTADLGRAEDASPALAGLGDIRARPEVGGFLNLYLSPQAFLTSSLRYGSGNDRKGLLLDLGAGYAQPLSAQWRAALGVAATLANADYLQDHYGVTPAQSQRSVYAAHSVGAGLRDVRANASLNYFVSKPWTITGAVSVSALQGESARSPIVRQRSSATGVLALGYRF
jgi:outer membrane scaffolding protein for murein synthesis (MipA/OmpV family)